MNDFLGRARFSNRKGTKIKDTSDLLRLIQHIQLFPRGGHKNPVTYPGERTAGAFVDYVSRRIPHNVKKLSEIQDILNWVYDVSQYE